MADGEPAGERAGYWRRVLAFVIDGLLIAVPASIVAPLLFAGSGGYVQMGSTGLDASRCLALTRIPAGLSPLPPDGSNFGRVCDDVTLLGRSARTLVVGRFDKTPTSETTLSRSYMLDANDRLINGHDVSWIEWLVFLGYVVTLQHRAGRTLGQKAARIRLAIAADRQAVRIPWKALLVRYGVLLGVYLVPLPFLLVAINRAVVTNGGGPWIALLVGSGVVWGIWSLWNLIRIVRRRPAVYDRVAGLEVLRVPR